MGVLAVVFSAPVANGSSQIKELRVGYHKDHTRVVLECRGDLPLRAAKAGPRQFVVEFTKPLSVEGIKGLKLKTNSAVRRIRVISAGDKTSLEFSPRGASTEVNAFRLESAPARKGHYRYVLDFYPDGRTPPAKPEEPRPKKKENVEVAKGGKVTEPAGKSMAASAPALPETPHEPATPGDEEPNSLERAAHGYGANTPEGTAPEGDGARAGAPSMENGSRTGYVRRRISRNILPEKKKPAVPFQRKKIDYDPKEMERERKAAYDKAVQDADKDYAREDYQAACEKYDEIYRATPQKEITSDVLYRLAHSFYFTHKDSLAEDAPFVIEYYRQAMKKDDKHEDFPVAMYRSGLGYAAMENLRSASEYFEKVIAQFPGHPIAGPAWLNFGYVLDREESYPEAIQALLKALKYPMREDLQVAAHYYLGKIFSQTGDHQRAIEQLDLCLKADPDFHEKKPDILRYRGTSRFAMDDYDGCREDLMKYINIAQDAKDRGIILARVAETYLKMGDRKNAEKLYMYIKGAYPGSEGTVIAQLRQAEELEASEGMDSDAVLAIYKELNGQPLAEPLARLVQYKLASAEWKRGDVQESIGIIDEVLQTTNNPAGVEEFLALKEQIVIDRARAAFEAKDYFGVIRLYKDNMSAFQALQSTDIDEIIADSYGHLSFYSKAVDLYEQLLEQSVDKKPLWRLKAAEYAFKMGDTNKAIVHCQRITDPDLEPARIELLAQVYFSEQNYPEAIDYYRDLVRLRGGAGKVDPERLLEYAESVMSLKRYAKALEIMDEVGGREEGMAAAGKLRLSLARGRCHQELKATDKAIGCYEKAVTLADNEELKDKLSYEIAGLYLGMGKTKEAEGMLNSLLASKQSFWQTAAKQQLETIRMNQEQST